MSTDNSDKDDWNKSSSEEEGVESDIEDFRTKSTTSKEGSLKMSDSKKYKSQSGVGKRGDSNPTPPRDSRLIGGADRSGEAGPSRVDRQGDQRGQQAAQRQVQRPPIERPINLSEERLERGRTMTREARLLVDFDIEDTIGLVSYQSLLQGQPDDYDPDVNEFIERVKILLDDQASFDLRQAHDIEDPFVNQLTHLLRLSGLTIRSWNLLQGAVFFDDSIDNITLINRIVFASQYQGFDPSIILKKLIRSWQEGRRLPAQQFPMHYQGEHGPEEWIYTNHENFMNDMTVLVLCFINRGAVIGKILKKSARDYNNMMRMLVAKYNIRANEEHDRRRRAEALGPEIVTLPRISACLCQLTTELFHRGFGRTIINIAEFGQLPMAFFSPMFSSVVRKAYRDDTGQLVNIHPQIVLVNILVDNVLHIRDRVTPLDQIWTYYLASYNSSVMIDEARISQCNNFGITVHGRFINDLLVQRDRCIARIRHLRPHERIDDFIREMGELA